MSQQITISDKRLLITDSECSLEVIKQNGTVIFEIKSDVEDNIFMLDSDSAHILSIFLKHI